MMFRAEPTKQKTRRPEQSGITGAVSPKKIGKERKECPSSGTLERRKTRKDNWCGSKPGGRRALEVASGWARITRIQRGDAYVVKPASSLGYGSSKRYAIGTRP
jgi:hypothetical protein